MSEFNEISLDFVHSRVILVLIFNEHGIGNWLVLARRNLGQEHEFLPIFYWQKESVGTRHSHDDVGFFEVRPTFAPLESRLMRKDIFLVEALSKQRKPSLGIDYARLIENRRTLHPLDFVFERFVLFDQPPENLLAVRRAAYIGHTYKKYFHTAIITYILR